MGPVDRIAGGAADEAMPRAPDGFLHSPGSQAWGGLTRSRTLATSISAALTSALVRQRLDHARQNGVGDEEMPAAIRVAE